MSLRSKFMLIFVGVFLLLGMAIFSIQRFVIFPSFLAMELYESEKDMERCIRAIQREIHHIGNLCMDWAAWDDTCNFVETGTEEYIDVNLQRPTFKDNNLNLIIICDIDGNVKWGKIYYPTPEDDNINLSEFPIDRLPQAHPLLLHHAGKNNTEMKKLSGIFMSSKGPMLIASRSIIASDHEGPPKGTFIMGRFFNDKIVKTLVEQTHVNFQIFPVQIESIPEIDISADKYKISELNDEYLWVYNVFPDVRGNPAILIRAEIHRRIAERGRTTVRHALIFTSAAGAFVLLVMLLAVQRNVLNPISRLTYHALAVGKSDDLNARISMRRKDEIGTLAKEFDRMLIALSNARQKLLDQSYNSGMAEMASGVLHNIRNAMTPVAVAINILQNKIIKAPITEIMSAQKEYEAVVSGQLSESVIDNGKNRFEDIINFIMVSNRGLMRLTEDVSRRLDEIKGQVEQIEKILDNHQKWAAKGATYETFQINDILRSVMTMIKGDLRDVFTLETDGCVNLSITANRLTLVQVFANILLNAAESISRAGIECGIVRISAYEENNTIHITVCDNGDGIAPDHIERIFERGFSTKPGNASGIGLHWCANALSLMNSRIFAQSEGKGKGACIHLTLPRSEFDQNFQN